MKYQAILLEMRDVNLKHILMSLRQMRRLEQTGHQVGFSVIHSGDPLLDDFQAGWIAHTSFEVHHRLALEDHFTAQLF
ncbi:hypothetical protein GRJ2_003097400 [Grus japonensis]|uniref:Uncharacterized protein n=1 Tax=Grus japonensis TaxID=30415 RepID=A0ABC9Y8D3_GRUJA